MVLFSSNRLVTNALNMYISLMAASLVAIVTGVWYWLNYFKYSGCQYGNLLFALVFLCNHSKAINLKCMTLKYLTPFIK